MTESASEVLRNALTTDAENRRQRVTVYLNASTGRRAQRGRWISEVGFYSELAFAYAEANESNFMPGGDEGRAITKIFLVPYGRDRDARRLASSEAIDRAVRTTRTPGQTGLAAYPTDDTFLGPADLENDTSCPIKTQSLLTALRRQGGAAVHAVVTRSGAVSICAPLDPIAGSVPNSAEAVCIAVESACRKSRTTDAIEEAPWTDNQLVSLAVLIAKIRSAYPAVTDEGIQYAVRPGPDSTPAWFTTSAAPKDGLLGLVLNEGAYDVSTEVFLQRPPAPTRRSEAQSALGGGDRADTLGASSVLLGAYVDIAAMDRSEAMQHTVRSRTFVQRARVAHQQGDEGAEAAAEAGSAEQLTPVIPTVENTSPHVFDYDTGLWGDGEVV